MRTQMLVCISLAVCGAAAAWHVVLSPAREELARQRTRLVAAQAAVQRATQTAQRLPLVERDVARLEGTLHRHPAMARGGDDTQGVWRRLHQIAAESNLRLNSFTPRPPADHTDYREWPIELGLEGGFGDVAAFFERIASEPQLVSVTDLRLKTNTTAGSIRRGVVSASCVATTFAFGDRP